MSIAVAFMAISAALLIGPAIRKRIESRSALAAPKPPAKKRAKKKEAPRERKG